jgi:hypothetical protein
MPVPLIAAGVASLIARAAVSTAAKKALTQAAAKGLTKKQVAELVVRNEARAAKALANKGIKTGPKRYEYRGTKYSDPKLDAAYRASKNEGSVEAMAKRMLAENPEKAARIAEGKAKVVMARNRAQTVARVQKKKELTTSAPKVKRVRTTKPTRTGSAEEAALVAKRVRPPKGYSGAKVVKPIKRVTKPVDTSAKITKPGTKKTADEIKEIKKAAKERRIAANARGRITGKDSVTKAGPKRNYRSDPENAIKRNKLRLEAARDAAKKDYKNKGRAERQRDVDDQEVPQGQTIRGKFYPEGTTGIPARSTRTGNTIVERTPKVREDLPPKDEYTAIKKAFAELTKKEKEAMRTMDDRAIQGILREKIVKGPNKKPAGPKDAPIRKRLTPEERLAILKRGVRARRTTEAARNARLPELKKQLTPAQRKAIAEAIARAKRNSK